MHSKEEIYQGKLSHNLQVLFLLLNNIGLLHGWGVKIMVNQVTLAGCRSSNQEPILSYH